MYQMEHGLEPAGYFYVLMKQNLKMADHFSEKN